MLHFRSALNMHTAQRSLQLPRQPTGASHFIAEQRKIWKTSANGALDCIFYKNDVLLTKRKCQTIAIMCYIFLSYGKWGKECVCVRLLVFRASLSAIMQSGVRPPCKLYSTGGKRDFKLL